MKLSKNTHKVFKKRINLKKKYRLWNQNWKKYNRKMSVKTKKIKKLKLQILIMKNIQRKTH